MPHVLDPDRMVRNDRDNMSNDDHRARADLVEKALHETGDYAQQLWHNLAALRQYLFDSLPADPRSPGPHPYLCASPTGPDDTEGWERWVAAYASISSVLCGPQGDSGQGLKDAQRTERDRRTAANMTLFGRPGGQEDLLPGLPPRPEPPAAAAQPAESRLRTAAMVAVGLLAVRGALPRRRRPRD